MPDEAYKAQPFQHVPLGLPLQAQALLKQLPPGFRGVVHQPINPCGVFPLVFLRNTADSQECVGRGANQQLLEILRPSPCVVRGGAIETFLQTSYMLFHGVPIAISPRGVEGGCGPFDARVPRLTRLGNYEPTKGQVSL